MVHRAWWIYLALVCVLIGVYLAVPPARLATVTLVGAVSATAVAGAALARRSARRTAWLLIAAAILVLTAGEIAYTALATGGRADEYPSLPDIFTAATYPLLAVGLIWLSMPRSPRRDGHAALETAALSLGGILIMWVAFVQPAVVSMHLTGAGKVMAVLTWAGDMLVVAAAIRMVCCWWRVAAARLLALAVAVMLAADLAYGRDLLDGVWASGGPIDLGILAFCGLCGVAALLPSMDRIGTVTARRHVPAGGVTLLAVALLVAPSVLLIEATRGPVRTPVAIAIVSAAIAGLVVARLAFAARDHRRAVDREVVLRRAARELGLAMTVDDVVAALGAALADLASGGATAVRIDSRPGDPRPAGAWPDGAASADPPEVPETAEEPGMARMRLPIGAAPPADPAPADPPVTRATAPASRFDAGGRRRRVLRATDGGSMEHGVDGDGMPLLPYRSVPRERREVVFAASAPDLHDLEDVLTSLADQAAVALDRIDLAARVRDSEREQDVLAFRAAHDGLTGLANADLFREQLRAARATCAPDRVAAVLIIDLDDFKAVNDTLGHEVGDAVLVIAAQRIRASLRREDLGARLGGDEFAVLLRDLADGRDAERAAARITLALAEPARVDGIPVACRGSVGVATASTPQDFDGLLRKADTALYAAKSAGKGSWRPYDPAMHSPLRRSGELRAELERALRGQPSPYGIDARGLHMHYQPIVELASGTVRGFEALIRWEHPRYGMVPAPDIIGVAEQTGLILPLGDWVMERAFADATGFTGGAGQPYVSVNVSATQIARPGFSGRVRERLRAAGLDPSRLVVELTESQLLREEGRIWGELDRVRALGARVAIDDYGTGYASLSYLRHPMIGMAKLDLSFLEGISGGGPETLRPRTLLRAVRELTAELGMDLIVEGVETEETRAVLIDLGVRYGQGYLFATAMPIEDAIRWTGPTRASGAGSGG